MQSPFPTQNRLLAALPDAELALILAQLEPIALPIGKMLYEPGEQLSHAYFPTTAIASLQYVMESGASAETAGVGREGMIGTALFMGGNSTPSSAVVQTAGMAFRLDRRTLKEQFNRNGVFQQLLLRYTQALMTQMAQTAVCNRHHCVEQQLCRWLLLTLDRTAPLSVLLGSSAQQTAISELVITQELIANMLGVRREGITEAAGKLQAAGVIRYRRGHIAVLQRNGLESRVCECYSVVKKEIDRLLLDVSK
jgi:CRP-like cAMP-binding protein